MLHDVARAALATATTPAAAVARWYAGRLTGAGAALSAVVRRDDDLLRRQHRLRMLRLAAADPRVAAVVLRIEGSPGGWAAAWDLRETLRDVSASGTTTVALLENPGNAALWIASACDRVLLAPMGQVLAVGIGGELTFAGAALRRLGLEPDLEAAGAYKSAGEPFTRSFPSAENRRAVRAIVHDLHRELVSGIAQGRGLTEEAVADALSRAPLSAPEAEEIGLIDGCAYPDEIEASVEAALGRRVRVVPFAAWSRWVGWADRFARSHGARRKIVVLHLQGPVVVDGTGGAPAIRARHLAPVLQQLAEDDAVIGVVLHVSSPGGSAYASDLLWRRVDRLARNKPVVAAFEDVAASGGFYLSAPAGWIVARPGTLTGSIGVVGGKIVAAKALRHIGVHTEAVSAGPNATLFSPNARFSEAQRARFRAGLQRVYDGFVERVAAGRGRPIADVEPHCRGRVWTGRAAVGVGLVDALGGLDEAVARVDALAGVAPWARRRVDRAGWPRPSWLQRRLRRSIGDALPGGAAALVAPVRTAVGPVARFVASTPGEALALWPYDLTVR